MSFWRANPQFVGSSIGAGYFDILSRHRSGFGGTGILAYHNEWKLLDASTGVLATANTAYSVLVVRSGNTISLMLDDETVSSTDCASFNDVESVAMNRDASDGGGKVPLMVGAHYWNNAYYHGSHPSHYWVGAFPGTITDPTLTLLPGEAL